MIPIALTIAGSDPSGGAGIQADLKTFTSLGVYGSAVITALTAQNSMGVSAIEAPTPGFVAEQLRMIMTDMDVTAAKTGMLYSAEIIAALAPLLTRAAFPIVVDPVCVAQSGAKLLQDDAVAAVREQLFPLATLVTPNRPEAELFTGMTIRSEADVREALNRLLTLGCRAVLLKGGHAHGEDVTEQDGDVVDWLGQPGHDPLPLPMPRVDTEHLHGTGCTLSAAITAIMCTAEEGIHGGRRHLHEVIRDAQLYLNRGLKTGYAVGKGPGPVNHLHTLGVEPS
jgi:hydroxymethylpyrimidine/phosphomethylpyrimidine kinase